MAITVGVLGESGDGKTTSIVINPDGKFNMNDYNGITAHDTVIINADRKMLPFPLNNEKIGKWENRKNLFNISLYRDVSGKNSNKPKVSIEALLTHFNSKPEIKRIIIDTLNGIMVDKEMRESKTTGFSKWLDLALDIYDLITLCNSLRDDLIIYVTGHTTLYTNTDGEESKCLVTNGRKLEKIKIESKLPIVLFTKVKKGNHGDNEYFFETQKNRNTAKSPMGMFEEFEIPNSLKLVDDKIRKFYGID